MLTPIANPGNPVYPPSMRYVLAALLGMLIFSGCSNMDPDDRAFFYDGAWLTPEKGAQKRIEKW